jgi:hypothetical protein
VAEAAAEAAPAAPSGTGELDAVAALWSAVVDLVRSENARLGAAIARSWPVQLRGEELTLAFGSSFLKKQAEGPADRMTVGEALRAITGQRLRLSYELRAESEGPAQAAPPTERSEEEWVRRFQEEFDAEELAGDWDSGPAEGAQEHRERGARAATSNEKGA